MSTRGHRVTKGDLLAAQWEGLTPMALSARTGVPVSTITLAEKRHGVFLRRARPPRVEFVDRPDHTMVPPSALLPVELRTVLNSRWA